ncbi:hypothetical protein BJ875DRAFT_294669 [Amylocarpus encephaloides]|uniref:Uncharacterized protein n=1 Tax=Amylocarpus encephaloides TaxID=45428 RepID=A0A9P8C761_9HELO|nr:hypothetical protein BJ875DRAFT_294669 [Amylocarpus encephaloides]
MPPSWKMVNDSATWKDTHRLGDSFCPRLSSTLAVKSAIFCILWKFLDGITLFITNGSSSPADVLMFSAHTIKGHSSSREFDWHNESISTNWISSSIALIQKSKDPVDPSKPPPKSGDVIPVTHTLYKQLVAATLAVCLGNINTTDLRLADANFKISRRPSCGISPAPSLLIYAVRPKPSLPRMPNIVGSAMAYRSARSAGADFMRHSNAKGAMRGEGLEDERYGCGRCVGTHGKPHEGIERQGYIVSHTTTGLLIKALTGLRSRTFTWRAED